MEAAGLQLVAKACADLHEKGRVACSAGGPGADDGSPPPAPLPSPAPGSGRRFPSPRIICSGCPALISMTKRVFTWPSTGGRAFVPGRMTAQLLPPPRARPEWPLGALQRLSAPGPGGGGAGPGSGCSGRWRSAGGLPRGGGGAGPGACSKQCLCGVKRARRAWTRTPTPPPSQGQVRREEKQGHPADPGRLGDGSTPAASMQPGRGPCGDPTGWGSPAGPRRALCALPDGCGRWDPRRPRRAARPGQEGSRLPVTCANARSRARASHLGAAALGRQ